MRRCCCVLAQDSLCAVCILFLPCHDQLLVLTPTYLLSVTVAPSHGHVAFEAKGTDDMMLVQCSWFLVTAAAASCSCQKQTNVCTCKHYQNTKYSHFAHCEQVCVVMWILPFCTALSPRLRARNVFKQGPNKGRPFYACPKPRSESCNHFEWGKRG